MGRYETSVAGSETVRAFVPDPLGVQGDQLRAEQEGGWMRYPLIDRCPMHTWSWQVWQGLPYLTCSLLEPWPHGFFTRQFAPRSPQDLSPVLDATAQVFQVKQVHGDRLLSPTEIRQDISDPPSPPPADGIVTEATGQTAWVCSADCTPALLGDVRSGQVAAIHAGWRGTAAGIVPKAIARMQAQGSQVADLRLALGPAIAGAVYQVEQTVAEQVLAAAELSLAQALALAEPPVLPDLEPGKVRLDVRRAIAQQVAQVGMIPAQVAIAPHCTFQDPTHFFSYRRDGRKAVQWSGIVSGIVSGKLGVQGKKFV